MSNVNEWFDEDEFNSVSSNEDTNKTDFEGTSPSPEHFNVLKRCFGHKTFRPTQWKIIRAVMIENKDTCAIMATGYGKSLCFQFPSVFSGGVTIVISPLISLMEDQVLSLKMMNIPACFLGSAQNKKSQVLNDIFEGKYSIIYATPEFCLGDCGSGILHDICNKLQVDLLAIDEAHCVSQWGHDFRHQYRNLWKLRSVLVNVPILAVTATATQQVQDDIIKSLKLKNPFVVNTGFDRPNLYFEVVLRCNSSQPFENMKKYMTQRNNKYEFPGPTIIYCITRKDTESVSANLKCHSVKSVVYNAGMTINERKESHEMFSKDKVQVIVATVAFGMGIDKPDVRLIIHYGASKDIESYYQEVGRAGRDGQPAKCIMLYKNSDFNTHSFLLGTTTKSEKFKQQKEELNRYMKKYVDLTECRRNFLLNYFESKHLEEKPRKYCCDNCTKNLLVKPKMFQQQFENVDEAGKYNMRQEAALFLEVVNSLDGSYGTQMYSMILRGSHSSKVFDRLKKNKLFAAGKHFTEEWWKIVVRILDREGYLKKISKKNANYSYSTIGLSSKGENFLNLLSSDPDLEFKVIVTNDMKKHLKPKYERAATSNDNTESQWIQTTPMKENIITPQKESAEDEKHRMALFKCLMNERNEIAFDMDVGMYLIASNTALMKLARCRPRTVEEFKENLIEGFNEGKIEKFGQKFLNIINTYCEQNNFDTKRISVLTPTENIAGNNLKKFIFKKDTDSTKYKGIDKRELRSSIENNPKRPRRESTDSDVSTQKRLDVFCKMLEDEMDDSNDIVLDDTIQNILDENISDEKEIKKPANETKSCEVSQDVKDIIGDEMGWMDSPMMETSNNAKTELNDDDFDGDLSNIMDDIEDKTKEVKLKPYIKPKKVNNKAFWE